MLEVVMKDPPDAGAVALAALPEMLIGQVLPKFVASTCTNKFDPAHPIYSLFVPWPIPPPC